MPTKDYKAAVASVKQCKPQMLEGASEQEREEIMAHWPWDNMNEEAYMQLLTVPDISSCCKYLICDSPTELDTSSEHSSTYLLRSDFELMF